MLKKLESSLLRNSKLRNISKKKSVDTRLQRNIGVETSRQIPLDLTFYRTRYPDLAHLNDAALESHWHQHGYSEGRYASALHAAASTSNVQPNSEDASIQLAAEGVGSTQLPNLDPGFYAASYPDLAANGIESQERLARHFARFGRGEGRYPNLGAWLSGMKLPADFALSGLLFTDVMELNLASGLQLNLQNVLDIFLGKPTLPVKLMAEDKRNAAHYLHMAKHYLATQQRDQARALLQASLSFQTLPTALELLGNIYLDEGHNAVALTYYDAAREMPGAPKWLYFNRATCLARLHRDEQALESLAEGLEAYPDFTFQLDQLDEFAEKAWTNVYACLMGWVDKGNREQLIKESNAFADTVYRAYLRAAGTDKHPELLPSLNLDRILIVGDYHVPQCERYRINQKIEQLEAVGKTVTAINWMELEKHQAELASHDIVIFYRVPAVPKVLKAMAQTNATGKLSLYEIDDLIFEPLYPPALESYGGYVSLDTYRELTRGMALFNTAARYCRLGLVSTEPLRAYLAGLVFGGECLLHRNGLDSLNQFRAPDRSHKRTIDIFYGSGTQAHNQDFIDLALPAIEKLLSRHTNLRLVVVGYLKLPQNFTHRFAAQLRQLPAMKSVQGYWSLLEQADINLAVLHDDEINACKSELKWFEAACFGLPSVVSDTANYRDVIRDGEDAFIAGNAETWEKALTKLVKDADLRQRMGQAALERVKHEYSLAALGQSLTAQIHETATRLMAHAQVEEDEAGKVRVVRSRRKVALVNVFFPPQAIGGATRVVADNFKALQKQYGDDFELCVFTADSESRTPHQLSVYDYHGVRVYRATTLFREHMDWHPKDPEMYRLFCDFLACEQPDLIHFHCVQRLTASIVEAARDAGVPYLVTAHDAWWISDFQFLVDHEGKLYPEGHADPFDEIALPPNISPEASTERKFYLKALLADARQVLTVSNAFADIYRKNGVADIDVTPNGISDELPWAPKDTSYTKNVVGGHFGGMSEHKGYFLLKQAVLEAQPENMEFLVVDHSKEEGYESREYWGKVPVTFVGRIPQHRMVELYRSIDVLFAPSTWPESFGLVTREAAACGCWVVASNLGGIGEDVTSNSGNVIEPNVQNLCVSLVDINKFGIKEKQADSFARSIGAQVGMLARCYKEGE